MELPSFVPNVNASFHITSAVTAHSDACTASRRVANRPINPSGLYTRSLLKPLLDENAELSVHQLQTIVRQRHGFNCTRMCIWRARKSILSNDPKLIQELGMLEDYLVKVKSLNPGSATSLERNAGRFYRCFIALKPWIDRFLCGTKLLFIDGTFLKGRYKGILLLL